MLENLKMCLESLAKRILGRRKVFKLRKSWRFKKTADDKICLLKDQDFDSEIDHTGQNTRNDHETLEDGVTSYMYDLTENTRSNRGEIDNSERLAYCTLADPKERCEMVHLKRNDKNLDNVGGRQEENVEDIRIKHDRIANAEDQYINDLNDDEAFLGKHLHRLIKQSRRLSQKSNIEFDNAVTDPIIEETFSEKFNQTDSVDMQFQTLEERCRYYWNTNSDSDDESDCDELDISRDSDVSHDNDRSRDDDRSCDDSYSELDDTLSDSVVEDGHEVNDVQELRINEKRKDNDNDITQIE